ncbi:MULTISPECIES: nucleotidyl transferase AbiEii/AbiGii toxin family protein [unclassified Lentimicrobium]|uniref:nucleotidyl transferase AbiEii/AbiGii toxin family protein n=1 Tax=unclassified Lentimicrobium TaxID=2677434 RepID=UPI00155257B3|nr:MULTISPECIES: nucleotidyl transferase AbiEii/AbiGii toxin family protein [unclassified Lentimicrobium]NPD47222.1 nucleotidyl transferase AbiEii/AbiGii toxin family protein [Lentimicrobium sp. S6]NPD83740.1 nucleotidyl transferase AbiEii/AbiGii toxin family protein [Lentimicrobium sp. L6]
MKSKYAFFRGTEYGSSTLITDKLLLHHFNFVDMGYGVNNSMGKSYFVGDNEQNTIKIDLFHTDTFVFPMLKSKRIRIAQLQEVAAMKLEVIGHSGRKKDFWDLHELMEHFTWQDMIGFYTLRSPYSYTPMEIIKKLIDFSQVDIDLDPICLKNKYWELIKLDIEESLHEQNLL